MSISAGLPLYFLMTCYWLTPVESSYREVSLTFRSDNGGLLIKLRANPFNLSIYQFCPQLGCSGIVLCILPVLPLQACFILWIFFATAAVHRERGRLYQVIYNSHNLVKNHSFPCIISSS